VEETHLPAMIRRISIHTAEPQVTATVAFGIEMAIGKFKSYKSLGIDRIPTELFQNGVKPYARGH
jgi:hypothetical protein